MPQLGQAAWSLLLEASCKGTGLPAVPCTFPALLDSGTRESVDTLAQPETLPAPVSKKSGFIRWH